MSAEKVTLVEVEITAMAKTHDGFDDGAWNTRLTEKIVAPQSVVGRAGFRSAFAEVIGECGMSLIYRAVRAREEQLLAAVDDATDAAEGVEDEEAPE